MTLSAQTPPPALEIRGITAGYPGASAVGVGADAGGTAASAAPGSVLDRIDLTVLRGELLTVLGPSGCGKSTLLRVIAGLHPASAGEVRIGGRTVSSADPKSPIRRHETPPEHRDIGLVNQHPALFPHLTVADNITFGLRSRSRKKLWDKQKRQARVAELLQLTGLVGLADRLPHELSGGQQHRVAIARALAPRPSLLLLDEAFGSLDAGLRAQLRTEVRSIIRQSGATDILVTHDQDEALAISDRIALMRSGNFAQVGSPEAVYRAPVSEWVARFLGDCNVLIGHTTDGHTRSILGRIQIPTAPAGPTLLLLRPEHLRLAGFVEGAGALPALADPVTAVIERREFVGHSTRYTVRIDGDEQNDTSPGDEQGQQLLVRETGSPRFSVGQHVRVLLQEQPHVIARQQQQLATQL